MTDKEDKPSNVKPLFKGMPVTPEETEPNENLIEYLKALLRYAETGELQSLCCVGGFDSENRLITNMVGNPHNVFLMHSALVDLERMFYDNYIVVALHPDMFLDMGEYE